MRNRTRETVLATRCDVAANPLTKGLGLIPRAGLRAGEGLLLPGTSTITMFFMRFAIDAVFLNREWRVVRVAEAIRPWTFAIAARGADSVLELPVGAAAETQVGDVLISESASDR